MILPSGYSTTDYSVLASGKGWNAGWPNCGSPSTTITLKRTGQRLSVHQRTATLWTTLLNAMEAGGYLCHTPEVWCWAGECRAISGTSTPSNHSWWNAVDINAPNNPYTMSGQHDIPDWVYAMFRRFGFGLGADYSGKKDWMHVEFMGTPGDADIMTAAALREFGGGQVPTTTGVGTTAPVVTKTPAQIEEEELMTAKDDIMAAITSLRNDLGILVWTKGITGNGPGQHANELLAAAAVSSGIAASQITTQTDEIDTKLREMPVAVWTQKLTGKGANEIMADLVADTSRLVAAGGGTPSDIQPPVTTPPVATPASEAYTVQTGDTLGAIANTRGTTVAAILALNPQVTNPDVLDVGQVLQVPKA